MSDIVQNQEPEYDLIPRHTVVIIDRTRVMECSAIGITHLEIGKLFHDKKIESKHGSGVVNR